MKKAVHLQIKPVSTNKLHFTNKRGGRTMTNEYVVFKWKVFAMLPDTKKVYVPTEGDLVIHYEFGITDNFDASNCVKGIEDTLADKYKFNDKQVRFHTVMKTKVKRGQEYIRFRIVRYDHDAWYSLTEV